MGPGGPSEIPGQGKFLRDLRVCTRQDRVTCPVDGRALRSSLTLPRQNVASDETLDDHCERLQLVAVSSSRRADAVRASGIRPPPQVSLATAPARCCLSTPPSRLLLVRAHFGGREESVTLMPLGRERVPPCSRGTDGSTNEYTRDSRFY